MPFEHAVDLYAKITFAEIIDSKIRAHSRPCLLLPKDSGLFSMQKPRLDGRGFNASIGQDHFGQLAASCLVVVPSVVVVVPLAPVLHLSGAPD